MSNVEVFRTPDEQFANLPGWDYAPQYYESNGLRLHYVDEGSGSPVVLAHGMPTWGYLWRKVMPPLLAAGYRCVVPDHAGFGRSDKPTSPADYTFFGHCDALRELIENLDLQDVTLVVHDWGGPIGLRVATQIPDRIKRIVAMDTGVSTGGKMSDAWMTFRDFAARTEDLPIGFLVQGACKAELDPAVFAAYEAPFPEPQAKAGARAFPALVPLDRDHPDAVAGREVLDALATDGRPKLVLWADSDPVLPITQGQAFAQRLGVEPPTIIADAGHFLQEDQGEVIGNHIVAWLSTLSA